MTLFPGTIYAYDAPYPTQKLWEPFTADRAPSLAGKPKFFFMQVKTYLLLHYTLPKGISILREVRNV